MFHKMYDVNTHFSLFMVANGCENYLLMAL